MPQTKTEKQAYSRRWYRKNRDRHRATTKRRYNENREAILKRERRRYQENRDAVLARVRKNYLRREYGLSPEDFDALVISHSGRCAICNVAAELRIDHDHVTGNLRGLLCSACNIGLGHFKDDSARLVAAAHYLEEG